MLLFKTIEEVQEFWPTLSTTEFVNIKPFIVQATRDFIIPAIGKEQYDDLNEWYNEESPDESEANELLLEKVQATLAMYANYYWIDPGQLQIGDSGIRIATTDTLKTAFQWQIEALKTSVIKQAGSAMDDLLEFMETNKDDYELWAASTAYTQFKDCFITSAAKFTEIYSALGGSRLNFLAIRGQMKQVEEFMLQAELSPEFYAELRGQYLANDLSDENADLIPMIQKAVAHLTMSAAFTQLVVGISENGVLSFNTTANRIVTNNREPVKDARITKLELQAEKSGKAHMVTLKEFLKKNISYYPTYAESSAYDSTTTDTSFKNESDQGYVFMG